MVEESTNGKMGLSFRAISGLIKEKEKVFFSIQTIKELMDIGETMFEMNNPFTTNPHKLKSHTRHDYFSFYSA
jgi:hypothetical protein